MRIVAVIPARGGSKGILKKNLQVVGGRTLVARCVGTALESHAVERVLVSTDDADIAKVARRDGAEVVHRPLEISGDEAKSESALLHTLDALEKDPRGHPEVLLFMQATSPFTRSVDVDAAVATMIAKKADVVFSVTPSYTFQWNLDSEGLAKAVGHNASRRLRRQDTAGRCMETGSFYLMRVDGFLKHQHRFFGKVIGFQIPSRRAMEIDNHHDLEWARWLAPRLDMTPIRVPKPLHAIVFDFDGVFTENTVYVDQEGRETIRASRGDGMGIDILQKAGIPCIVLSNEKNPVVLRRCEKLKIPCIHGIEDKLSILQKWVTENYYEMGKLIYVGNDINDLACVEAVGCGVAVADAHPTVLAEANHVLDHAGGHGAVRELSELILKSH